MFKKLARRSKGAFHVSFNINENIEMVEICISRGGERDVLKMFLTEALLTGARCVGRK